MHTIHVINLGLLEKITDIYLTKKTTLLNQESY